MELAQLTQTNSQQEKTQVSDYSHISRINTQIKSQDFSIQPSLILPNSFTHGSAISNLIGKKF